MLFSIDTFEAIIFYFGMKLIPGVRATGLGLHGR
jgi:hypothetical protein